MHSQDMLEAHPGDLGVDTATLAAAVESLVDCADACAQCADACLAEPDIAMLARCIRLNLDCADVCGATARVVPRQTEGDASVTRQLLEACIAVCRSCAEECERHATMEHCRICAERCRDCEQRCQSLLALSWPAAPGTDAVCRIVIDRDRAPGRLRHLDGDFWF